MLAVAGGLAFTFTATSATWRAIGWVIAVLLLFAALRSRRVPAAIVAFVTGLGPWWDGFILLGAIYIVLAFMLVRAGRQETDDQRGARR